MVKDLEEESIFTPFWGILSQGIEEDFEKTLGPDLGGMDVDGEELGRIEAMDEQPEGGGLADASGTCEDRDDSKIGEELEPSEGLRDSFVSEDMIGRSGL